MRTLAFFGLLATMLLLSIHTPAVYAAHPHAQVTTSSSGYNADGTCPQPPANLDPATINDADLALYGFPPRRTLDDGSLDPDWAAEVTSTTTRLCVATPDPDGITRVPSKPHTVVWNDHYPQWGGPEMVDAALPIRDARMVNFIVPCANYSGTPSNGSADFWVGIGGDPVTEPGNAQYLLQAGAAEDNLGGGNRHELWIADVPADTGAYDVTSFTCGVDHLNVEVWSWPGQAGHMFVQNMTTNYSATYINYSLPNDLTAEWITERDTYSIGNSGPLVSYLPNFGTFHGVGCQVTLDDGNVHGYDMPFYMIDMYNGSTKLATTSVPAQQQSGSNKFTYNETWYATH